MGSPVCIGASAPGNLLLFGEYAVTVPGGLGIACGVEPRVSGVIEEAPEFSILGTTGSTGFAWELGEPRSAPGTRSGAGDGSEADAGPRAASPPLLAACVEAATSASGFDITALSAIAYRIRIDSSALYREEGTKRGLGSSAAVAVVLSALLLCLFRGSKPTPEEVFDCALEAHRGSQGGRGSGYDVAASTFGYLGLFEGGEKPKWRPLSAGWLPSLSLHQGPKDVSTGPAIRRFEEWKTAAPGRFGAFMEASNAGVEALTKAGSWREAVPTARRLSELGRELGRHLDTPAEVPETLGTCRDRENRSSLDPEPTIVKAVGAGGELFVSFDAKKGQEARLAEGIRWHT